MDSWSRGRVTLAGDAGYCPGPAVGGSTSLAVVGAYVLAGELAAARGDHQRAFRSYESALMGYVKGSRQFALQTARRWIPQSKAGVWLQPHVLRAVGTLPSPVLRAFASLSGLRSRLHDTVRLRDYSELARRSA